MSKVWGVSVLIQQVTIVQIKHLDKPWTARVLVPADDSCIPYTSLSSGYVSPELFKAIRYFSWLFFAQEFSPRPNI